MTRDFTTVAEDLEYLRREWNHSVQEDTLRRGSVQLRLLIVDDLLGQAWRGSGFSAEPKLPAVDLGAIVSGRDFEEGFAFAGGGNIDGLQLAGLSFRKIGDAEDQPPPHPVAPSEPPPVREFRLSEFREGPCAVINGEYVRRREVIKYFANVKGGAHLQRSSRVRRAEEDLVRRLSKLDRIAGVVRTDALYYELLSIGQAVANAPDVIRLVDRIRGRG